MAQATALMATVNSKAKNAPRMLTPEEQEALRQDLKDTIAYLKKLRETEPHSTCSPK